MRRIVPKLAPYLDENSQPADFLVAMKLAQNLRGVNLMSLLMSIIQQFTAQRQHRTWLSEVIGAHLYIVAPRSFMNLKKKKQRVFATSS